MKCFLVHHDTVEISHPPYYPPPLTLANLLLFPAVKTAFKGRQFQDTEDIKGNIIAKFKAVPLDAFNDCFIELQKSVASMLQSSEMTSKENKLIFYLLQVHVLRDWVL